MPRLLRVLITAIFPDATEMGLRAWSLSFPTPSLEQAFRAAYIAKYLHQMRYSLVVGMFAIAIFAYTDIAFFPPEVAAQLLVLRLGVAWAGFLAALAFSLTRFARQWMQPVLSGLLIWVGGCIIAMIIVGAPLGYEFYVGLIFTLIFGYTFVRARALYAAVGGTVVVLAYEAVAVSWLAIPRPTLVISSLFLLGVNGVGIIIAYTLEYHTRRDFFLSYRLQQEQETLRRVQERTQAILNNSSDAILLVGEHGHIYQANPAFERFFALNGVMPGALDLSGLAVAQEADVVQHALRTTLAEARGQTITFTARRQDGTTFAAELTLTPLHDLALHDQAPALVCTLRDITVYKEAEAGLRAALARAHELSDLKTRFISMTSHEFRTPLTTISSSAFLLNRHRDRLSAPQRDRHFAKIQTSIHRMTALLDDVLLVGKIEAGKMAFHPVPCALDELCREHVEQQTVIAEAVTIDFTCRGEAYPLLLDERQLSHILDNLISNAVKYSPAGSTVQVELVYGAGQVTLRVQDEGIGIPLADQARLFEAFHRASNARDIQGTGLGLAIVKQAVDLHDGTITLESAEGAGTTVTVMIPAVPAPVD